MRPAAKSDLLAFRMALHFNAEQLPGRTRGLAAAFALAGTGLAAVWLRRRGWTPIRNWSGQVAFALHTFLALAFVLYANAASS